MSSIAPLPLEAYRELISLDEPFVPSRPVPGESREELVRTVLEYLRSDGTAGRLGTAWPRMVRQDARALLAALLTVRAPGALPEDVQGAIDRLLQAERLGRPAVDPLTLPRLKVAPGAPAGPCALWQGDITRLAADAIVNAANSELLGCFVPFHACIDNAIHAAAGPRLREDCARIIERQGTDEPTGQAKATRAYNLPSRYVLHTVGPIVDGTLTACHVDELSSCYRACLETAAALEGVRTVAFCCVSTGVFGFPGRPAAEIALRTVARWMREHPGALELVVFDVFCDADRRIYEEEIASKRWAG